MNRIQVIVIVGFALAFAAGGSVGVLIRSDGAQQTQTQARPRRHLAKDLGLTAEQQEQMRKIWSEVMGRDGMGQFRERRLALHGQRTEAVEALLTDAQREEYDQIFADYNRGLEEMDQERHRLVQQAVERTKSILTMEQAKKYEEIRKSRRRGVGPGGPPGSFLGGRRGGPRTRPAAHGPMGMGPFGRPRHVRNSNGDREAEERAADPSQP